MVAIELKLVILAVPILILISFYLQTKLSSMVKVLTVSRMKIVDKRAKKINEIITGIKIIKLNAWEKIISEMVAKLRLEESTYLKLTFFVKGLAEVIVSSLPVICSIASFILYNIVYKDEPLSIPQIINIVNIFNSLISPVKFFLMSYMFKVEAEASAKRMSLMARLDKFEPLLNSPDLPHGTIEIMNADFAWEDPRYEDLFKILGKTGSSSSVTILNNISIKLNPGELLMLVGKVGSGKSSLLQAMMNEMIKKKGEVKKNGKIAYVPQEAFLLNDTIRNNIIFGLPFDQGKFDRVLDLCELREDLKTLSGGSETEIGERGINLSGGQKQRISIARAVYSEADIYLIDDALSALDAHVGKNIMNNIFTGCLKGKTIVLSTHYLNLLEKSDRVCLINQGIIEALTSFKEIKKMPKYIEFSQVKQAEKGQVKDAIYSDSEIPDEPQPNKERKADNKLVKSNECKPDNSKPDPGKVLASNSVKVKDKEGTVQDKEKGVLTVKEKRFTGQVGPAIYLYYIRSAGVVLVILFFIIQVSSILSAIGSTWWVTRWASNSYNLSSLTYLLIYAAIGVVVILLLLGVSGLIGVVASNAAINIFSTIVWNILRRPMSFFDTTPSGVILNRCTADVSVIDMSIPSMLQFFITNVLTLAIVFIMTIIISPIVLLIMLFGACFIFLSFGKFVATSTELKRLNQMAMSPVISIGAEFISGITIIRNYEQNINMIDTYARRADKLHASDYHEQMAGLWMRSRMEYVVKFIVAIAIGLVVINQNVIQYITI